MITVRRLAGSAMWEVLVGDFMGSTVVLSTTSASHAAERAVEEVRRAGGRAEITYDDQDSSSSRRARQP